MRRRVKGLKTNLVGLKIVSIESGRSLLYKSVILTNDEALICTLVFGPSSLVFVLFCFLRVFILM